MAKRDGKGRGRLGGRSDLFYFFLWGLFIAGESGGSGRVRKKTDKEADAEIAAVAEQDAERDAAIAEMQKAEDEERRAQRTEDQG